MNKLFSFAFILLCLLPIIPNKLKGFPVILLLLISLSIFIKTEVKKANIKLIVINSGIIVFYSLSLFYTKDLSRGLSLIETSLSLLVFPVIFYLFLNSDFLRKKELIILKNKLLISYIIGSSVFSLIAIVNFFFFRDPNAVFPMNIFIRASVLHIPFIGQHPIYFSIIIAIALIFSVYLLFESKKKIYLLPIILFLTLIIMLAGKATILALFIIVLSILFILGKKRILIPIIISILVIGFLIPSIKTRTSELFQKQTYSQLDTLNSSSIRYYLNKSSFELLQDNWLIGIGIGDVKTEVMRVFQSKFNGKEDLNSHNQYFSIWLATGVFGFIFFLYMLVFNFRLALNSSDLVFLSLLILFTINFLTENLIERQTGVILFSFLINFFGFIKLKEKL